MIFRNIFFFCKHKGVECSEKLSKIEKHSKKTSQKNLEELLSGCAQRAGAQAEGHRRVHRHELPLKVAQRAGKAPQ